MRVMLAGLFVLVAGAIGWVVGARVDDEGPRALDAPAVIAAPAPAAASGPVRVVISQASAQPAPTTPNDLTAPRPTVQPNATLLPEVDESALRYFARTGDQRRLEAEMARLKLLYPDWIPPANPSAPEVYVDPELDALWRLFSQERYAEVRAGIAERGSREPDWEAPESLIELLDEADARVRLVNASNAKQWNTVIDTASGAPSLLTCAYVDILWRVAEAFANTDRLTRANDTYVYILTNCENPNERVATIEKAADLMSEADIEALLAFERGDEFAAAKDILIRRRVSVASENPELVSTPEDLTRLEAIAATGDTDDALLLGWYYYRHKEPRRAIDWFEKARERDPTSAKAIEGYSLALIGLRRFADAEEVGYEWRDRSADNLAAYLIAAVGLLATDPPVKISEARLERIAETITREQSLQGGEQMGWYAYNLGQVRTASQWFETVRRWDPDYEPAAYGLAVTRWAMNDRATVNAIIREWGTRSERIANIGRPGRAELRGSQVVVEAPPETPYDAIEREMPRTVYPSPYADGAAPVREAPPAMAYVDPPYIERPYIEPPPPAQPAVQRPPPAVAAPVASGGGGGGGGCNLATPTRSLSPQAALARGWCLMDRNRPAEAAIAFDIALGSTSASVREDAAYGGSLANLRAEVTDRAWVSSSAAPMSKNRQRELNLSLLVQQASAAYADGRYVETILALDERARLAPEQTDLMVLRGWAYYRLNRLADAKRIFEAVARTGYADAQSGLAAVYGSQIGVIRP